jgi:cell fate regulator YaaT (PSP1 superfamily)
LTLSIGDIVATEASPGHDIGIVTLTGELVRIQMKKKGVAITSPEITKIYRKASQKDIDIWSNARDKEEPMKVRARELAISHKLEMKISDIEFQGDGSKATFYYTANDRVDFRLLIKDFAKAFSARIEMKQVGFRQEASRLGGIGSCGRELCCSTWLTDFRSVNTSAARYQQLSLNPQKLAGQCGKLKCCLNYELDMYLDAIKSMPKPDSKLQTEKGEAVHMKTDVFKRIIWYAYKGENGMVALTAERVAEIKQLNKDGVKPKDLADFAQIKEKVEEVGYQNVVGQDSLTRFEKSFSNNNKRRPNRKPRKPNPGGPKNEKAS